MKKSLRDIPPKLSRSASIIGTGSYVPDRVLTNAELESMVETSDQWIVERTGIKSRHIAGEGETTRTLGTLAARRALEHAGVSADEVDLIILATATPDNTFPATATLVQYDLGITRGAAFDVQAVCSGFVYALSVADAMLKAGAKPFVAVGAAHLAGSDSLQRLMMARGWTIKRVP